MLDPGVVFKVANLVVLPAWGALIFFPRSRFTYLCVHRAWVPLALSLGYAFALGASVQKPGGGGFGSLVELRLLFTNDWALLGGWLHYLAFDLILGGKVSDECERVGLLAWWKRAPFLLGTFLFGPLGLIATHALATLRGREETTWTR